jgi:hypothetical protein
MFCTIPFNMFVNIGVDICRFMSAPIVFLPLRCLRNPPSYLSSRPFDKCIHVYFVVFISVMYQMSVDLAAEENIFLHYLLCFVAFVQPGI